MKIRRILRFVAIALVMGIPIPGSAADALTGPRLGDPAPDFAMTTLDGKRVSLASFAGKILVVNVWGTWCPPCRLETPDLVRAERSMRARGVAFLGVDTTEQAPIVRAFASAHGIVYPQALDTDARFARAYDVAYFPSTYVIDARGILRARYVDVMGPAQIASLVAAARGERNAVIVSPLQTRIFATLSDPSLEIASGAAPAVVRATVAKIDAAIVRAQNMLDESDPSRGDVTDLIATQASEAALRDRAIGALGALVVADPTVPADAMLLARLRGDAARDREHFPEAIDAYEAALALDAKNAGALAGLAYAANRLEKYDIAIDADRRAAELDPTDVSALVDLARAQAKAGHDADATATFERAHAVAQRAIDAHQGDASAIRIAAWAHLYDGRVAAKAGDRRRARREFDRMLVLSKRLPVHDTRHDMYLEEGQEAIVALGLAAPQSGATVSLAPWTGVDLPGSIPNTTKYRLVVTGTAGRSVALHTSGVPKGWVASFCTDRVCAPFRTTVVVPESGVKIIEFQLVPPTDRAAVPRVRVTSTDGAHESTART